jgi:hypothetical protein
MHYVVQRFGFRPSRGFLALFIIAALLVGAAFWIGPLRPRPAELHLLALSGDGRFREFVGIPSAWSDSVPPGSDAAGRFPLILAIHNAGPQPAQPSQLALSLPARYRVASKAGPLEHHSTMGNPLVRYELPLKSPRLQPGSAPAIIPGVDTLWLEPLAPSLYCTTLGDSVPEFIPAPPFDRNALARVKIFYSLEGRSIRQRQTGLLTVQMDPNQIKAAPPVTPPVFETVISEPPAAGPEIGALEYVGARVSSCGDPSRPVELHTALWETPEGGRFFVMYHGGAPRKHLYDLNRDSIIELEMWDADADGKFEARRAARFAIPGFIMPLEKVPADSALAAALAADTMPVDSAWLGTFHDTTGGPLRFSRPRTAQTQPRTPAPGVAGTAAPVQPGRPNAPIVAERVDSAALRIFNRPEAGPLRFIRAQRGDTLRAAAPPPRPAARRDTGPRLLGRPYNAPRDSNR